MSDESSEYTSIFFVYLLTCFSFFIIGDYLTDMVIDSGFYSLNID